MSISVAKGRAILARHAFTILLLVALVAVAIVTRTADGSRLADALASGGFAPDDLLSVGVLRALYSAFLTGGGLELLLALAAVALFVGGLEARVGGWTTFATVAGVHLATLLAHAGIASALHASGSALGAALYHTRDVGPSAGYVGALGALIALQTPPRTRRAAGLAVGLALVAVLAFAIASRAEVRDLSADAAHVLALGCGYAWGRALARRRLRAAA